MDFKSIATSMYPHWILGALMIFATINAGYKDFVRIDKNAIKRWIKFLLILTAYRILAFKLWPGNHFRDAANNIIQIPWALTLTVFWEDSSHGLPLLLIRHLIGTKRWTWPIHALLTAILMLEFGLGHTYQGIFSAILLSLYVPYSVMLGKKYGFGTVMIGHTLFDLTTILSLKFLMSI